MFETVAVVGATGAVGTIICQLLAERQFPFKRIKFLASGRSAGKTLRFAGADHTVEELTPESFAGVDLAIGSTPDEVARDFAPWAVERGCVVVDESGYWRMDPQGAAGRAGSESRRASTPTRGIIASPNCSTTQMVVAMKPLHDAARIRRVIVSTYQATSGMGLAGSRELDAATRAAVAKEPFQPAAFAHNIAFNLIPQIGSQKEQGYTSEEMKMVYETRKIFGDDSIQVCPTCVRVPVENCHSESILVETEKKLSVDEARRLLAATPGIIVVDDLSAKSYPDARNLRRPRRSLRGPHSRRSVEPPRAGLLVRERQPSQGRRHQRRADRRAVGPQGKEAQASRPRSPADRAICRGAACESLSTNSSPAADGTTSRTRPLPRRSPAKAAPCWRPSRPIWRPSQAPKSMSCAMCATGRWKCREASTSRPIRTAAEEQRACAAWRPVPIGRCWSRRNSTDSCSRACGWSSRAEAGCWARPRSSWRWRPTSTPRPSIWPLAECRRPAAWLLEPGDPLPADFPYPAVLKPRDGAGSLDIQWLPHRPRERTAPQHAARLERFQPGVPASVAVLCGPGDVVPLVPCGQRLAGEGDFSYQGGWLPLESPLAARARRLALRAVQPLPTPLGYLGIDMVLGSDPAGSGDVVVEINPRLTTSYVGLRAFSQANLAAAMIAVAQGGEARLCWKSEAIQFTSDGTCVPLTAPD